MLRSASGFPHFTYNRASSIGAVIHQRALIRTWSGLSPVRGAALACCFELGRQDLVLCRQLKRSLDGTRIGDSQCQLPVVLGLRSQCLRAVHCHLLAINRPSPCLIQGSSSRRSRRKGERCQSPLRLRVGKELKRFCTLSFDTARNIPTPYGTHAGNAMIMPLDAQTCRERAKEWRHRADTLPDGEEHDTCLVLVEGYTDLAALLEEGISPRRRKPLPIT
jgi:hypothetical protein